MTLYEYINQSKDWENTVFDKDYEIETYFYKNDEEKDSWDESMEKLSRLLIVDSFCDRGVIVNLSELIESKIDKLEKADLFADCDIDLIMDDIEAILSGNVPEEWMQEFVNALE